MHAPSECPDNDGKGGSWFYCEDCDPDQCEAMAPALYQRRWSLAAGRKFRKWLEGSKYSQRSLARRLKCSPSAVANYATGSLRNSHGSPISQRVYESLGKKLRKGRGFFLPTSREVDEVEWE